MMATGIPSKRDEQDFVLVALLVLDRAGCGMMAGSVEDIAAIVGKRTIDHLSAAGLTRRTGDGGLELTAAGRDEARSAAGELAVCR